MYTLQLNMGLFKDCGCGCNGKKQEQRLMNSILAGLVFFMIASPDTFRFMRSLLGKWVSGPNGCPTTGGLFLHTFVFILVTWGMMNIKTEGYTAEPVPPAPPVVDAAADKEIKKKQVMESVKKAAVAKAVSAKAKAKPSQPEGMGVISENDRSFAMEGEPPMPMGGVPPAKSAALPRMMAPPRMADVPSPMPGMSEEPVGMSDTGAMYAPMDINSGMDLPSGLKGGTSSLSITCADGRKPIVA